MTETEACIALNMVPNMGPVRMRKLLRGFESPERILRARAAELTKVDGVGPELAGAISTWEDKVDLSGELRRMQEFGASVITQKSPEYPLQLREIPNPPILLYVWGKLEERDHRSIGIVGSRKTSHYGLECAKKLSYQLAYAGLTVVSGLARGIDTAAHQGALAAKGRTLGVIGSGLMRFYPEENLALAAKMAENGAVLSEFPMEFPPSTQTFPYRNRIVAGWGSGVLVVEAGLSSGALITANQALEHGRLVYAVPGQIDRPTSFGSNRLIQQGAKLVTGAGDILDDLNILLPVMPEKKTASTGSKPLSALEEQILGCFGEGEATLDQIAAATDLPAAKISSTLFGLEMKRLVKPMPGQRFVRL